MISHQKKKKEYIKGKSPLLIFIENKNRRSYACLEIRSRSEEAINSMQNGIYSLQGFFFFLLPTLSMSILFICFWIDLVSLLVTTGNTSAVAGYTRV